MIYFNIYFLVLTLVLFSFLIHSQKVKIYLYLLTIFFISILSAIRWKTGTDWDSYYELFSFGGNLSEYMNYYHFEYFFKFSEIVCIFFLYIRCKFFSGTSKNVLTMKFTWGK